MNQKQRRESQKMQFQILKYVILFQKDHTIIRILKRTRKQSRPLQEIKIQNTRGGNGGGRIGL